MDASQPAVWSTYVVDRRRRRGRRARAGRGRTGDRRADGRHGRRADGVRHASRRAARSASGRPARHTRRRARQRARRAHVEPAPHARPGGRGRRSTAPCSGGTSTDFGGMPMFSLGERGDREHDGHAARHARRGAGVLDDDLRRRPTPTRPPRRRPSSAARSLAEPFDIEDVGRFAVLADPQGVDFGVISARARGHVGGQRRHPLRRTFRPPDD